MGSQRLSHRPNFGANESADLETERIEMFRSSFKNSTGANTPKVLVSHSHNNILNLKPILTDREIEPPLNVKI